jgi:hypothetical protein
MQTLSDHIGRLIKDSLFSIYSCLILCSPKKQTTKEYLQTIVCLLSIVFLLLDKRNDSIFGSDSCRILLTFMLTQNILQNDRPCITAILNNRRGSPECS